MCRRIKKILDELKVLILSIGAENITILIIVTFFSLSRVTCISPDSWSEFDSSTMFSKSFKNLSKNSSRQFSTSKAGNAKVVLVLYPDPQQGYPPKYVLK